MSPKQHKFRVLADFKANRIGLAEAVALLDVKERTVHQLTTLWGDDLPFIVPLIDKLLLPTNTKNEQAKLKLGLATTLSISYRQVNRLLKLSKIDVPAPKSSEIRRIKHENAKNRRKMHDKHAISVISGSTTAEDAAEAAGLSSRQMYRLVGKLCHLVKVHYRDLAFASPDARSRIAAQIEELLDT